MMDLGMVQLLNVDDVNKFDCICLMYPYTIFLVLLSILSKGVLLADIDEDMIELLSFDALICSKQKELNLKYALLSCFCLYIC